MKKKILFGERLNFLGIGTFSKSSVLESRSFMCGFLVSLHFTFSKTFYQETSGNQ